MVNTSEDRSGGGGGSVDLHFFLPIVDCGVREI
jgi:hypothetical protein